MPTFGLQDEDLSTELYSSSDDQYFRRFIPDSMKLFGRKKFMKDHDAALNLEEEISTRLQISRNKAIQAFEEKRKKHEENFNPVKKSSASGKNAECSKQYMLSVSQAWLEECRHPSSTANISIHEAIEVEDSSSNRQQSITIAKSALDASELNNSVPSHLFDHTGNENVSFVNNSLFAQTVSSPVPISVPNKDFHLDSYNGARPSFAGNIFTSTPQMKKTFKFGGASIVNSPLLEESTVFPEKLNTNNLNSSNLLDSSVLPVVEAKVSVETLNNLIHSEKDTPKKQSSNDNMHSPTILYALCLEKKEDNELASSRFERENATLRVKVKRKVNDIISLHAKKTAKSSDLENVVKFLVDLIQGKQAVSNMEHFHLNDADAIAYAIKVIIDYSLNIVIIDKNLISVISIILKGIYSASEEFEKILLGRLLSASQLLSLDNDKCESFVNNLKTMPADAKSSIMNEERNIIKLFFMLFTTEHQNSCSMFNLKDVWRILAFILNSSHKLLGSVVVLNSVLENCGDELSKAYPTQFKKMVEVIRKDLLPKLDDGVMSFEHRRLASEAVHITVLRNTLENMFV